MSAELLPNRGWNAEAAPTPARCHPSAEQQLASLAAAVGPLRRLLAAIAARLVATRAWEQLCFARLSDYARERPGVSARQLQELARVHRALEGLPALEHALIANVLPWSKVRLVARVATPEDEQGWIARARALSTRALEHEVRPAEPSSAREEVEGEPTCRVAVRCTVAAREKWFAVRELAERVAGERLGTDAVLEVVSAEVLSAAPADVEEAAPAAGVRAALRRGGQAAGGRAPRAPMRALPHAVASLASGLESAAARELDRRLLRAMRLEQTLDAAMGPLLRRVRASEFEWRGGYRTLEEHARDDLGMSGSKARALVRLERAGEVCPELREAYRSGRHSWVKAQTLLPLLLLDLEGDWRRHWVAWASRVTVRRLAEDVERALLLRAGHHPAWQRCKFHPERAQDPIPPGERQLCAPDVDTEATQQLAWRVAASVALLFRAAQVAAGSFEAMLDRVLATWSLQEPGVRRDPVIARDGYLCAVPGCTSRRNLQDHHVVFRSAGGSDVPENRITLCAFHHLRGVHAGRMQVRGVAPDGLIFDLPLARYRSGDVLSPR